MVRLNTSHFDIPDPEMLIDYQMPSEEKPASLLRRLTNGLRGFLAVILVITGGVIAALVTTVLVLLLGLAAAVFTSVFITGAAVSLVFVVPGALIAPGTVPIIIESIDENRKPPN